MCHATRRAAQVVHDARGGMDSKCWAGHAQNLGTVESRVLVRLSIRVIALLAAAAANVVGGAQSLAPLDLPAERVVSYFIATPAADASARPEDRDLALWALATWEAALGGALTFALAADEQTAQVRLYWAAAAGGQYGEMRALEVDGRRGAAVFVRPDVDALGPDMAARARADSLFRDTIVYLTCLHELGHALGLAHTASFDDIMYAFGYGGDIPGYFERFRRQLRTRNDISSASILSVGDRFQLQRLYAPQGEPAAARTD
jgi:hypothetical protein